MPDRPNFPIPDDLTPDTFCLCIQIPNDPTWKRVFAGLLAQPAYWFNWQRDADHSGRILGQYWTKLFDQIDWSIMSCCCPDPLIKLNPDGSISVSTDGGVTYHTDNSADPRYTLPQPPPLSGDDGDDKKCRAANNIVRQMKDYVAGNAANIGTVSTLAQMAALAIGLAVVVFFDPALIPFLVGLMFELAAALLATTETAYNALFTDDDWGWILCELFCKMTPDGQIPASEFNNIQADFDTHFTGNAALTFSALLGVWQLPGINDAAKMPTTDNLDCSGCCAECDATSWHVVNYDGVDIGTIISAIGSQITLGSTVHPDFGTHGVMIETAADDSCCVPITIEYLTGDEAGRAEFGVDCGSPRWPDTSTSTFSLGETSLNTLYCRNTIGAFTVKVTFG